MFSTPCLPSTRGRSGPPGHNIPAASPNAPSQHSGMHAPVSVPLHPKYFTSHALLSSAHPHLIHAGRPSNQHSSASFPASTRLPQTCPHTAQPRHHLCSPASHPCPSSPPPAAPPSRPAAPVRQPGAPVQGWQAAVSQWIGGAGGRVQRTTARGADATRGAASNMPGPDQHTHASLPHSTRPTQRPHTPPSRPPITCSSVTSAAARFAAAWAACPAAASVAAATSSSASRSRVASSSRICCCSAASC